MRLAGQRQRTVLGTALGSTGAGRLASGRVPSPSPQAQADGPRGVSAHIVGCFRKETPEHNNAYSMLWREKLSLLYQTISVSPLLQRETLYLSPEATHWSDSFEKTLRTKWQPMSQGKVCRNVGKLWTPVPHSGKQRPLIHEHCGVLGIGTSLGSQDMVTNKTSSLVSCSLKLNESKQAKNVRK